MCVRRCKIYLFLPAGKEEGSETLGVPVLPRSELLAVAKGSSEVRRGSRGSRTEGLCHAAGPAGGFGDVLCTGWERRGLREVLDLPYRIVKPNRSGMEAGSIILSNRPGDLQGAKAAWIVLAELPTAAVRRCPTYHRCPSG